MPKIKVIKKGLSAEDSVFEKSGIKMEFTVGLIDQYIQELEKQQDKINRELAGLRVMLEKIEDPNIDIPKEKLYEFLVYSNYRNQIILATESAETLEQENPEFKDAFDSIEEKQEASKWIGFSIQDKMLSEELGIIEKSLEDYKKDREEAVSCLEE